MKLQPNMKILVAKPGASSIDLIALSIADLGVISLLWPVIGCWCRQRIHSGRIQGESQMSQNPNFACPADSQFFPDRACVIPRGAIVA